MRQAGFTLSELMITLSIAALLATMAGPSFSGLVATTKVKAAASDVQAGLMRARSEAIKRARPVEVVARKGDWGAGWESRSGNEPIQTGEPHPAITATAPRSITFDHAGRIVGEARPQFEFFHLQKIGRKRCLRIELTGRPLVTEGACG